MRGTRRTGKISTSYGHLAAAGTNAIHCSLRATILAPPATSAAARSSYRLRPERAVYAAAVSSIRRIRGLTNGKA